ncbi:IS1595 family transposase [Azospirillum brasilense]|uniref:IS1595 family transposase n=1 Tax=Azospirillum brasilense TaxID=192 RepID=UPI000E0AFE5A|nr:IS1595 family transposase [Azospirillum brasilense]
MKLTDFQEAFPDDAACMRFLEETVWANGRHCPDCGCLNTVPLAGKAAARHLYHCRDCHKQFTVTSGTWLHSRKLPLTKYFEILYYSVNSSFGMASTRIAEWTGVSQKSVWKILQAFRELQGFWLTMADKLANTVEFDTKYVGGKPRKAKGETGQKVKNKRGRGTDKQPVFVAAERQGEVRATVVPDESEATIRPLAEAQVDPQAHIMSDGDGAFAKIARSFALHSQCSHRDWDFARDGVHNNTAESFNSWVEHMRDVHFFVSKPHLQRYVNDVMSRWNLRVAVEREVTHRGQRVVRVFMEKMPLLDRLRTIFVHAVGCQVRRDRITGGIAVASCRSCPSY